ncbi:hypothetical protein [Actinomadura alba]|uniref:AAA family ATPase n=1 Tax=Actinomadura alba TaxID=406431 RepID=A0ABR7LHW9_9ACTN|nr:hypothetical protein [Actinomadura alba]MBC6464268.1 hypothetical protein [Actinomadura alba]
MIGPPAAGKTTYVLAHARPGDVIVDYDRIANALTCGDADSHRHPEPVQRVAHRARTAAIREALKQSTRTDVWIIHTQPQPDTLAEYATYRAKVITIDPGRDVVLTRCDEQRSRGARAAAERWYSTQRDADQVAATASRAW